MRGINGINHPNGRFLLGWVAHITGGSSTQVSESDQLLSPGWSLCGQRSQKTREMKATVRALERFMSMSWISASEGVPDKL